MWIDQSLPDIPPNSPLLHPHPYPPTCAAAAPSSGECISDALSPSPQPPCCCSPLPAASDAANSIRQSPVVLPRTPSPALAAAAPAAASYRPPRSKAASSSADEASTSMRALALCCCCCCCCCCWLPFPCRGSPAAGSTAQPQLLQVSTELRGSGALGRRLASSLAGASPARRSPS